MRYVLDEYYVVDDTSPVFRLMSANGEKILSDDDLQHITFYTITDASTRKYIMALKDYFLRKLLSGDKIFDICVRNIFVKDKLIEELNKYGIAFNIKQNNMIADRKNTEQKFYKFVFDFSDDEDLGETLSRRDSIVSQMSDISTDSVCPLITVDGNKKDN